MKVVIVILCLLSSALSAQNKRCNYSNGKCVDSNNKECLNVANPSELFKNYNEEQNAYDNVDAECVDFKEFNFNLYIQYDYKKLTSWNLKGSDLTDAKFHFANMIGCDLRGTNFEKLSFGYTEITGSVSSESKIPEDCKVIDNKVKCRR